MLLSSIFVPKDFLSLKIIYSSRHSLLKGVSYLPKVLFPSRATIEELRQSFVRVEVIEMDDAPFSRGIALMKGAERVSADGLMFFTDVDMLFTCDALHRIRLNTILNAQVSVLRL